MAGMTPDEQTAQIKVWYDYGDWLTEKGWCSGRRCAAGNLNGDSGSALPTVSLS